MRVTNRRMRGALGTRVVHVVLFLACRASAQSPPPAEVRTALTVFDQHGAGDGDGRVELPDLNPESLPAMFRDPASRDRTLLWTAFQTVCRDVAPIACPKAPGLATAGHVRAVLAALAALHPNLVSQEHFDQVGAVRTDSLRGIHDGADPPADRPWLWSHFMLNGLDVLPEERAQLGLENGFPTDPDQTARWFPGYFSLLAQESAHIAFGVASRVGGWPDAGVSVRGRTAATLHEAVRTPRELRDADYESPGMLFLRQEPDTPDESLVGSAVRHIRSQSAARPSREGPFLLVTFGANDLFSYRQIVVAAPEVCVEQFEADLRRLSASTAALRSEGTRRIFVVPPPIDFVFEKHVLPGDARLTDGKPVPKGSVALHHWWLAAHRGRSVPRKDVLSPAELAELRARHTRFRELAHQILGVENGWLVVDTTDEFRSLVTRLYDPPGVVVDRVPGYGELHYLRTPAVLSTDSVHPTPFGYLLWAELVLEEMRDAGVALRHDYPARLDVAHDLDDKVAAALRRVFDEVRRNPSFFRPTRYPLDPAHPTELDELRRSFEKLDPDEPEGFAEAAARARFIWPFVPDYLLARFVDRAGIVCCGSSLHHEIVAKVLAALAEPSTGWPPKRRRALRDLVLDFVADGELSARRHARYARSSFGALGRVDDNADDRFRQGHTPGVLTGTRTFSLGAEAATGSGSRSDGWQAWMRAGLDFAPYRSPITYLPAIVVDYTRIESQLGLSATWAVSERSALALEPVVRPLSLAMYADALPGFAVELHLPGWQPLFAMGDHCTAFSRECTSLLRFGMALVASWAPWRDLAFDAGPSPSVAFHVALRGYYSGDDRALPEAGTLGEITAGVAAMF